MSDTAAEAVKMVRAELTADMWKALRTEALDQDVPVQRLVGDAIEDYLIRHGYKFGVSS